MVIKAVAVLVGEVVKGVVNFEQQVKNIYFYFLFFLLNLITIK